MAIAGSRMFAAVQSVILAGLLCTIPGRSQNGPFRPSTKVAITETMDGAIAVAAGDVNRDGKPDMIVGSKLGIHVLAGSGGGQFETGKILLPDIACDSVVPADFDGDGKLDLAAYSGAQKTIYILKGNGDGTFAASLRLNTLQAPRFVVEASMLAADLNQDGVLDLVAVQAGGLCVFSANGDATFRACTPVDTGSDPRTIVTADFNGDGIPDPSGSEAVLGLASIAD
jgi:hypothetical protein